MTTQKEPTLILCVDDNEGDLRLLKTVFTMGTVPFEIETVTDGSMALDFLAKRGKFVNARTPDLILLDLNLPKLDGRAVLAAAKSDPKFREIPILMLTSSNSEADIKACYALGANAFIAKPIDVVELEEFVKAIESFWLKVALLPKHPAKSKTP